MPTTLTPALTCAIRRKSAGRRVRLRNSSVIYGRWHLHKCLLEKARGDGPNRLRIKALFLHSVSLSFLGSDPGRDAERMSRWASPPPNWSRPQTAEPCYRHDAARLVYGDGNGKRRAFRHFRRAQSALRHHPSQHCQRRGNRHSLAKATAVCGEGKDGKAGAFEWTCCRHDWWPGGVGRATRVVAVHRWRAV